MRTAGGIDITDEEVIAAFSVADKDHDGLVNWKEFVVCLQQGQDSQNQGKQREDVFSTPEGIAAALRIKISKQYRDLQKAFKELDPDGSGYISTAEMMTILTNRWNVGFEEAVRKHTMSFRYCHCRSH